MATAVMPFAQRNAAPRRRISARSAPSCRSRAQPRDRPLGTAAHHWAQTDARRTRSATRACDRRQVLAGAPSTSSRIRRPSRRPMRVRGADKASPMSRRCRPTPSRSRRTHTEPRTPIAPARAPRVPWRESYCGSDLGGRDQRRSRCLARSKRLRSTRRAQRSLAATSVEGEPLLPVLRQQAIRRRHVVAPRSAIAARRQRGHGRGTRPPRACGPRCARRSRRAAQRQRARQLACRLGPLTLPRRCSPSR